MNYKNLSKHNDNQPIELSARYTSEKMATPNKYNDENSFENFELFLTDVMRFNENEMTL